MSQEPETVEIDCDLAKINVRLKKKDGTPRECYIQELDGSERDDFLNFMGSRTKISSDGRSGVIKDFKKLHARLISVHLHDAATEKLLTEDEIQEFPSTAIAKLHEMCKKLSALDEDAKEKAKND